MHKMLHSTESKFIGESEQPYLHWLTYANFMFDIFEQKQLSSDFKRSQSMDNKWLSSVTESTIFSLVGGHVFLICSSLRTFASWKYIRTPNIVFVPTEGFVSRYIHPPRVAISIVSNWGIEFILGYCMAGNCNHGNTCSEWKYQIILLTMRSVLNPWIIAIIQYMIRLFTQCILHLSTK